MKNKRNGLDNPRAQLRASAPTAAEVLASRMIADPLNRLQCCPTSDGAGAVVIGPDRGHRDDLRVEASALVPGGLLSRGHPLGATGTAQLAEIAWRLRGRAGPRQVQRHRVGLVETMGSGAAGMDGNACVVTILSAQD